MQLSFGELNERGDVATVSSAFVERAQLREMNLPREAADTARRPENERLYRVLYNGVYRPLFSGLKKCTLVFLFSPRGSVRFKLQAITIV